MLGVKGLEDYTYEEVKRMIDVYVHECIEDNEIDVTFIDSAIYGSRVYGEPLTGSDLDYVFEYSGDFSEDALYNILHEKDFDINGIYVDINPIRADKSGNIRDYIKKAEVYKKMNEGFCNVGYEGPIEIELEANTDDSPVELKWLCCVSQEYPKMIEFECTCQDNGSQVYFDIAKSNLQACYAEEGNWDSIVAKHLKWASRLKLNESAFNLQKNNKVSNVEFDDDEVSADQIKGAELYYKLNNLVEKLLKDDDNFTEEDVEHFKEYSLEYPADGFKYKVKNKEDLDTLIGECSHYFGVKCDLNWIDVSGITDMSNLFDITSFDGDISKWDVSNVKNMRGMFKYSSFNGDISEWDVSNVTDMSCMFMRSKFNRDISRWDVSNVTDMSEMFSLSEFNQDISDWDVSNVVHTVSMFSNCPISPGREPKIWSDLNESAFNLRRDSKTSDIEFDNDEVSVDLIADTLIKYKLKKIISNIANNHDEIDEIDEIEIYYFFKHIKDFENDTLYIPTTSEELKNLIKALEFLFTNKNTIEYKKKFTCSLNWIDVSSITNMSYVFLNSCFNGDISGWNVSNVTNMNGMFCESKFDGDISNWDVSSVTNMSYMFENSDFNGDISNWDVRNVTNMSAMFDGSEFNGDISNWDVSNAEYMIKMFANSRFNHDISNWQIDLDHTRINMMFSNCSIKEKNKPKVILIKEKLYEAASNFNLRRDSKVNNDEFDSDEVSAELITETLTKYKLRKIIDNILEGADDEIKFFKEHIKEFDEPLYTVQSKEELKTLISRLSEPFILDFTGNFNWIDVSQITDMSYLFSRTSFNGNISKWDVSHVKNMERMFLQTPFNKDISLWNVSNVENMKGMFAASDFNGDISDWDVSNVVNMQRMFYKSSFNGDISKWNLNNVNTEDMFYESAYAKNRRQKSSIAESAFNLRRDSKTSNIDFDNDEVPAEDILSTEVKYRLCKIAPKIADKTISKEELIYFWNHCNYSDEYDAIYAVKLKDELRALIEKYCFLVSEYVQLFYTINLNWIDVSQIKDMTELFIGFDNKIDISRWDVSNVEKMYATFQGILYDIDISNWDTHNVKDMSWMFFDSKFNGDISKWDVSNVEDMHDMFKADTAFNGDLSGWDVSNVTSMDNMFSNAEEFNSDISKWLTGKVRFMGRMFSHTKKFNQDISGWDIYNVIDMDYMFYAAEAFNLDLSNWDLIGAACGGMFKFCPIREEFKPKRLLGLTESAFNLRRDSRTSDIDFDNDEVSADQIERTKLKYSLQKIVDKIKEDSATEDDIEFFNSRCSEFDDDPFYIVHSNEELKNLIIDCTYALDYNCDLNWIDVREVTDMTALFYESNFDGDISKWDVSRVTNMESMFEQSEFNGDISGWDVSSVTNMSKMFKLSTFDNNISNWDVSNVTDMHEMFRNNYDFNQNISNWDVSKVENMEQMFSMAVNFTKDLSSWNIKTCCMTEDMFYQTEMPEKFKPKRMQGLTESAFNLRRDARTSNIDFDDDDISAEQIERTKLKYRLLKIVDKIKECSTSADDIEFFIEHCSEFDNDPFYIVHNNEELHDLISIFVENIGERCDLNWIDVRHVIDMHSMFAYSEFNGDISKWDVSCVEDMSYMFENAEFNGDISNWDVSCVIDMSHMFYFSAFNQNISQWDVSHVRNMEKMFQSADFDQDISKWDVSNVINMKEMFLNTSNFSHNISKWKINPDCLIEDMFQHTDIPKKFKPKALQKINC